MLICHNMSKIILILVIGLSCLIFDAHVMCTHTITCRPHNHFKDTHPSLTFKK